MMFRIHILLMLSAAITTLASERPLGSICTRTLGALSDGHYFESWLAARKFLIEDIKTGDPKLDKGPLLAKVAEEELVDSAIASATKLAEIRVKKKKTHLYPELHPVYQLVITTDRTPGRTAAHIGFTSLILELPEKPHDNLWSAL